MPFRHFLRAIPSLILLFLFLALAPVRAQNNTTTPGDFRAGAKSFNIPSPTPNLVEPGSDYRVLLELLAPTSNRLVAAYILPGDLDQLRNGKSRPLSEYALVEVPRLAEFADVTPDFFKQAVDATATQFGASLDSATKESEDEANRRLKVMNRNSAAITLDKPVYLGSLFSKPDASGFGAILAVSSNGTTIKEVMGLAVMRVQSRVFFAYLYLPYVDESSIISMRKTSEQWADSILSANKQ